MRCERGRGQLRPATVSRVTENPRPDADGPRPDWPDVLPGALTVVARRAPYAIALVCLLLIIVGMGAIAAGSGTAVRITLMIVSAIVGLAAVLLLFRLLQAGKPELIADAAGIKTALTPRRVPWEQIERVRVIPNRIGGSGRIGVVPTSLVDAIGQQVNPERTIQLLERRAQRFGAPLVVSLVATGISVDEARARLTELAAGRTPVTD